VVTYTPTEVLAKITQHRTKTLLTVREKKGFRLILMKKKKTN